MFMWKKSLFAIEPKKKQADNLIALYGWLDAWTNRKRALLIGIRRRCGVEIAWISHTILIRTVGRCQWPSWEAVQNLNFRCIDVWLIGRAVHFDVCGVDRGDFLSGVFWNVRRCQADEWRVWNCDEERNSSEVRTVTEKISKKNFSLRDFLGVELGMKLAKL